jgi:hypothetical protein
LRQEVRLRVFENRVLRRIFGPKRDEVTGEGTKLHNDKLNGMNSPNIIRVIKSRRMKWAGYVAFAYRVLVRKPEGKRPLGKPRLRWEDNIKMDFKEEGRGSWTGFNVAEDTGRWRALVNAVVNLRVTKGEEFFDQL